MLDYVVCVQFAVCTLSTLLTFDSLSAYATYTYLLFATIVRLNTLGQGYQIKYALFFSFLLLNAC